jgi:hypothetical protein
MRGGADIIPARRAGRENADREAPARGLPDAALRAPAFHRFVEKDPADGAVPPQATRVQVLFDDLAVYVDVTASRTPGPTGAATSWCVPTA